MTQLNEPLHDKTKKFNISTQEKAFFQAIARFEGKDKVVQQLSDPFTGHSVGKVISQVLDEDTMTMVMFLTSYVNTSPQSGSRYGPKVSKLLMNNFLKSIHVLTVTIQFSP